MASKTIYWSGDYVGFGPGQYQSLVINFIERDEGSVKVSYKYYAENAHGSDWYLYEQRRNVVTISVNGYSSSFDYQIRMFGESFSKEDTFIAYGVKNGITSLDVYYENARVGVDNPWYGPKSTGVFYKAVIGTIAVPDNTKYTITYNKANSDKVTNLPKSVKYYKGSTFKIPSTVPKDSTGHFVFANGYTTSNKSKVNLKSPTAKINSSQKVTGNKTYYASWKRRVYTYSFYLNSSLSNKYKNLSAKYTYGLGSATLPNLNDLSKNNSIINTYYKEGSTFNGWLSNKGLITASSGLHCSYDSNTNFWPDWKAITSKVNFDYCYDDFKRSVEYTYGTSFNFNDTLKDKNNIFKSDVLLRPGYRLVGWSYKKPEKIYEPFSTSSSNFSYTTNEYSIINYPTGYTNKQFKDEGITLYAVWEYYTTLYVYSNDKWNLALPFVYTNGEWKMALTKCFTDINSPQNPSWKL